MKVLLVNTSDHAGGAAIASMRLLKALRQHGAEATLLCKDHTLPAERTEVVGLKPTLWRKLKFVLERLEIYIKNGFSRQGLFAVDTGRMGNDITRLKAFAEADVIHLHWTNQAMLSLHDVQKILRSGKRVVITMHDMWTFTGVCHNAADCQRWLNGCGKCPQLRRPSAKDLSATTYRRKAATYGQGHFTVVGCSQWLAGLAAQAPLLKGQRVACVPNPIDTRYYAPAGTEGMPTRNEVRTMLGLPADKRLLLFTAYKVTDPNKGIDYLTEAVSLLVQEHPDLADNTAIVPAGHGAESLLSAFAVPAYPMGYVQSEERMRQLYQACDLLVMPTLMDNLPNTITEAMACGVPCVAFNVGGVPQMVDTGVNGYLAAYCNSLDFAHGIASTLNSQSYAAMCRNARAKAVKAYDEKAVAQAYEAVYAMK